MVIIGDPITKEVGKGDNLYNTGKNNQPIKPLQ